MFSRMRLELPLATRIIIATSSFMSTHKISIMVIAGFIFAAWHFLMQNEQFARRVDELMLRMPFFGSLLQSIMVSQFRPSALQLA